MTRFDAATADFNWLLQNVVRLDDVLATGAFPHVDNEIAADLVTAAGDFIGEVIAPLSEASDRIGVSLKQGRVQTPPGWKEAYALWREGGWPGLTAPRSYGGQEVPFLLQACVATMLGGADLAFAMVSAAPRAACSVLLAHGEPGLRDLCVPKLASGEWGATIAMTEPQAGTDVGMLRTKAVRRGDRFALSGSKMFISNGDTDLTDQILHLMLARIEGAPAGVKGLSLFLVPNVQMTADGSLGARNGVSVARLEEKMGLHGSATCVLNIVEAEGFLIGRENEGLQAMFTMMSELRIETGLSAVGIGASATAHARAYAHDRRQGRRPGGDGPAPIAEHPDVARMLSIMTVLTEGGRALVLENAKLIDLGRHAADEADRARADRLSAWLLPICKAALSDNAIDVANLGIQIFGGHGFVRESGAEQFLRDVRVLALYEGANGIQAIDLVMRKLKRDTGASLRDFVAAISVDRQAAANTPGVDAIRTAVESGLQSLERASQALLAAGSDREDAVLAGASAYLALVGRLSLAWMWLRMANAGSEQKRRHAAFFAQYYEAEFQLHESRVLRALGL